MAENEEKEEKPFNPAEWLKKTGKEKEEATQKQDDEIEKRTKTEGKKKEHVNKVMEEESEKNTKTITIQVPRPEPIYFWIVDYWKAAKASKNIDDIIKVEDWVSASDISQMYFNIRQRQMSEQREARDLLGKSYEISRLVVSLRNEKRRLNETLNLAKEGKEESLKAVFVDFVDEEAPGASMRQLETARELEFIGLRDLFFAVHKREDIDKLPTTERVKRLLRRKWEAYENWQKNAIPELDNRLDTVEEDLRKTLAQAKMYEEWAKPYLTNQKIMQMREEMSNPDMAMSFERMVAKTVLMVYRKELRIRTRIATSEAKLAAYHPVIFLEIYQRAIPQAVYGGSPTTRDAKVEVKVKWFAMDTEKLEDMIKKNSKMEERTIWEIIEEKKPKKEEEKMDVLKEGKDFLKAMGDTARAIADLKSPGEIDKLTVEKEVLPKMVEDFWEDFKSYFGLVSLGRLRFK